MPKAEFNFDDPLELNGVGFLTDEDTSRAMAECFVEEFMMLGYNYKQIFALFKNPHYIGMNMVLQNKGESFVRDVIAETFVRWKLPIQWPAKDAIEKSAEPQAESDCSRTNCSDQQTGFDATATDPMGNPVPKLTL
jgi:hypothetical protein